MLGGRKFKENIKINMLFILKSQNFKNKTDTNSQIQKIVYQEGEG